MITSIGNTLSLVQDFQQIAAPHIFPAFLFSVLMLHHCFLEVNFSIVGLILWFHHFEFLDSLWFWIYYCFLFSWLNSFVQRRHWCSGSRYCNSILHWCSEASNHYQLVHMVRQPQGNLQEILLDGNFEFSFTQPSTMLFFSITISCLGLHCYVFFTPLWQFFSSSLHVLWDLGICFWAARAVF